MQNTLSPFLKYWLGSLGLYLSLTTISLMFDIVRSFPVYGIIGYTLVILLLLAALGNAELRWHYILSGLTLVIAGAVAGVDIVLSRDTIVEGLKQIDSEWARAIFNDEQTFADLVNVLVILLNIFTGSLAAGTLFHGLNKRNFKA